ncbi:MAG: virulence factor family protein [Pseudomonadota bacterium]|nr:virulence factor family protein [Pseudomonadota bacterium]
MMRRRIVASAVLALLGVVMRPGMAATERLQFGRLGLVHVYRHTAHPAHVALQLSGRLGWTAADRALARSLAAADTLVLGVDIRFYLARVAHASCAYPAGDLEALSQYAQKHLRLPVYTRPVLVGRGLGATLAYGTLAQAPAGTFRGALGLGFCPQRTLRRPLCRGDGWPMRGSARHGYLVQPGRLTAPWSVLNSSAMHSCPADSARTFVAHTAAGRFTLIRTRPGEPAEDDAALALVRQAFLRLAAPAAAIGPPRAVTGLPLVEVPATTVANDTLVVMVSGDGGWAGLDREVARALAARGYSVVGLNSLRYFWTRRTPQEAGRDLARIMSYYLRRWNKQRVLLIGYSRGADVLPFMARHLPPALRQRVDLIALLGLGRHVDFEFHLSDWLPDAGNPPSALPIFPQITALHGGRHVLCLYGKDEKHSLCRRFTPRLGRTLELRGGHHFDGAYGHLADIILEQLKRERAATGPAGAGRFGKEPGHP